MSTKEKQTAEECLAYMETFADIICPKVREFVVLIVHITASIICQ